jgi:hypothetical protein
MSLTLADLETVVATAIEEGSNPYTALNEALWTTMDKGLPQSFFIQLYFLAGGLALCVSRLTSFHFPHPLRFDHLFFPTPPRIRIHFHGQEEIADPA